MRTVAQFRVEYAPLLDPDGNALDALPAFASDPGEVLRMYRVMSLARTFDTKNSGARQTLGRRFARTRRPAPPASIPEFRPPLRDRRRGLPLPCGSDRRSAGA